MFTSFPTSSRYFACFFGIGIAATAWIIGRRVSRNLVAEILLTAAAAGYVAYAILMRKGDEVEEGAIPSPEFGYPDHFSASTTSEDPPYNPDNF